MSTPTQQNSTATNTKKRSTATAMKPHVENASVSNLKTTRNEAKTANLARVNESQPRKNNQTCLKMETRLEPIKDLLASLPSPLNLETKKFATLLLSKSIEVLHCDRKVKYHEANPSFLPSSCRFKFDLNCKVEYEDNTKIKTQQALAKNILETTKQSLRTCIVNVQKIEREGAIAKLKSEFIKGLVTLFEYYVNFNKFANPAIKPPFENEEGAEVLLQEYFHSADQAIFDYLNSDKNDFITKVVKPRSERITYNTNVETTTEQLATAKTFISTTSAEIFPHIRTISVDLLKKYVDNLNRKEAETRTEALVKNRNTASMTAATAEAIEEEESVKPATLINLIDDRTKVAIDKENNKTNKKANKNKNKKNKRKRANDESLTSATSITTVDTDEVTRSTPNKRSRSVNFQDVRPDRSNILLLQDQRNATEGTNITLPPRPNDYIATTTPMQPTVASLQQQLNLLQTQLTSNLSTTTDSQFIPEPSTYHRTPSTLQQMNSWSNRYDPVFDSTNSEHHSTFHPNRTPQYHYQGHGCAQGTTARGRGRDHGRRSNGGRGRGRGGRGGANRDGRNGRGRGIWN